MNNKLTYTALLIFAFCLISSCSSDSPEQNESGKGAEVKFDVSDLTRANNATAFNKFVVYGDMKYPVESGTVPTVLFNKTEVEYVNGGWRYDGVQYWFHSHEHSFVAVTPLSIVAEANSPRYSNSHLSFNYAIPTAAGNVLASRGDVTDIIAAAHRRLYSDRDTNGTTTFRFMHIMSLINIAPALDDNLMSENDYITIHQMALSGFSTSASFNVVPAERLSGSQTDDIVIDVSSHSGKASLTVDFDPGKRIKNNKTHVSLFEGGDAIIMIPQAFNAASDATLKFTYTASDDPTIKELSIPLGGQRWDFGKSYVYRFTINRKGAFFQNTEISDWDVVYTGNVDAH